MMMIFEKPKERMKIVQTIIYDYSDINTLVLKRKINELFSLDFSNYENLLKWCCEMQRLTDNCLIWLGSDVAAYFKNIIPIHAILNICKKHGYHPITIPWIDIPHKTRE